MRKKCHPVKLHFCTLCIYITGRILCRILPTLVNSGHFGLKTTVDTNLLFYRATVYIDLGDFFEHKSAWFKGSSGKSEELAVLHISDGFGDTPK